jgi:hypothetical protein
MFRSTGTDTAESAPDVNVAADVIPLSVLQLDLDAPVEGWLVHLNAKGVEVTLDDLGRMSIARVDGGDFSPRSVSVRPSRLGAASWRKRRRLRTIKSAVRRFGRVCLPISFRLV